ncbi:MAG: outer membrane protein assembly factor BamB family protein [Sulfuricaulis sp.]
MPLSLRTQLIVFAAFMTAHSGAYASPSNEWAMYQRDAAHDGFAPDTLLLDQITFAWSKQVEAAGVAVQGIATSQTEVFTTSLIQGYNNQLTAQSMADGRTLWNVPFPNAETLSEPAYDDGLVWVFEKNTYTNAGFLDAFDATTGASIYHINFASYTVVTEAPTIANGHVYCVVPAPSTPGSGFGSISEATGQVDWLSQSATGDGRTASVGNGVVYGFSTQLEELNPADGSMALSIANPGDGTDQQTGRAPAIANGRAFVTQNGSVVAFDVLAQGYLWSVDRYATGQVATDGNNVFFLSSGALSVHDAASGALEWGWEAPAQGPVNAGSLTDNMIITKSHVIVTDGVNTYFVNRTTHREETSFSVSGVLAYAADTLLVGDKNGIVTAFHLPSDEIFKGDFE